MNKKPKAKKEWIREVRQKAEQALNLCDKAEQGKISAEEFEKRLSKDYWGPTVTIVGRTPGELLPPS